MPNNPPNRPASKSLVGLVGATAATLITLTVTQWEGTVTRGYLDPIGIPTKCTGDTTNVVVGRYYSDLECRASLDKQLLAHAGPVVACTPGLNGRPYETAASVSLAYNIGTAGFCKSTAARLFNARDYRGGCKAIGRFVIAGGRVIQGLVNRRKAEVALCLKGTNI